MFFVGSKYICTFFSLGTLLLVDLLLYNAFLCRHQQLTNLLNRYINEPSDHKPRESNSEYFSNYSFSDQIRTIGNGMVGDLFCFLNSVLYYWTLFFPTLSGAAILLIAAMLGGYGGIICCLLFPWLARSIFSQYHRMTTYQRYKFCFFV